MSDLLLSDTEVLFSSIKSAMAEARTELLIICPFIQTDILAQLLKGVTVKTTIITTWHVSDIQAGISDLELFAFCRENGIELNIHPRIHLKAYLIDWDSCLYGSANISRAGLALSDNFNFELMGYASPIAHNAIVYFKQILYGSMLVTDDVYKKYREFILAQTNDEIVEPDQDFSATLGFLLSDLPLTEDIDRLFALYSSNFTTTDTFERDCAIHDVVRFGVPSGLDVDQFRERLNVNFFNSPFIQGLLGCINARDGCYFGEVKVWVQAHCEDIPAPFRRDLTYHVQVLYRWISDLSDGEYRVDRPHYSQRIFRVKT